MPCWGEDRIDDDDAYSTLFSHFGFEVSAALAEGGRSLPVDAARLRPPSVEADLGLAMREAAVGVLGRDDEAAAMPLSASQQLSLDL